MKKRRWYHRMILGVVFGSIIFICLLIGGFVVAVALFRNWSTKRIDEMEANVSSCYQRFESIERSNNVYSYTNGRCLSFDNSNFDLIDDFDDIKKMLPSSYSNCYKVWFNSVVYATKEHYYVTYIATINNSYSYLVFRQKWAEPNVAEFYASIDNLPKYFSGYDPNYFDNDDEGFFFRCASDSKGDYVNVYYFNVFEKSFNFLGKSLFQEIVSYEKKHIKKEKFSSFDKTIMFNENQHELGFYNTCREAYEIMLDEKFEPYKIYFIDDLALCLYHKRYGFPLVIDLLAVFSYDWGNGIEEYQGIYRQHSDITFYKISK